MTPARDAKAMTDAQLLAVILDEHSEHITGAALDAFTEWHERPRTLSDKQKKWLYGVADRLGVQVAPSENIFSALPEAEQHRQRERAKAVKLPWE